MKIKFKARSDKREGFFYNHTDQARSVKAYIPDRAPPLRHFLKGGSKF